MGQDNLEKRFLDEYGTVHGDSTKGERTKMVSPKFFEREFDRWMGSVRHPDDPGPESQTRIFNPFSRKVMS